jgi:DNA-binding response OmpR family regulator
MADILLVEDDKTIRIATEFALTREGYAVTCAADGAAGLESAREAKPDLVLLDVMLPEMTGIEVARALRADGDEVPIIMLTALDGDADKVRGLDAGADDYITKPFSTTELLARVRAHLRRFHAHAANGTGAGACIEAGQLRIDKGAARVLVAGRPVELRSKEYALLVALAQRPGMLCTRQWLAEQVWNEEFLSTSRTIDTHVRRIRKAINCDGWTYIQTAHGMGYRFEARHEEGGDAS